VVKISDKTDYSRFAGPQMKTRESGWTTSRVHLVTHPVGQEESRSEISGDPTKPSRCSTPGVTLLWVRNVVTQRLWYRRFTSSSPPSDRSRRQEARPARSAIATAPTSANESLRGTAVTRLPDVPRHVRGRPRDEAWRLRDASHFGGVRVAASPTGAWWLTETTRRAGMID
jgi:hypothetical protein